MFRRVLRSIASIVALTTLVYGCSAGAGQSTVPSAGSGASNGTMTHFRTATAAEKAEPRPSLSIGSKIPAKDTKGNPGTYTLVTFLTTDDSLDFSNNEKSCDSTISDAPWYLALGNFSLPIQTTTLNECFDSSGNVPSAQNGLYIVKVGIGFFDLSVEPLSGPADDSSGAWVFSPLEKSTKFQFATFYTFFVASWSGSGAPGSVDI